MHLKKRPIKKLRILGILALICPLLACQQNTTSKTPPITEPPTSQLRYCGGFRLPEEQHSCDIPKEYCHRDMKDMCGAADAPGVCKPRPEICTQEYAPVCGCDGQTYSNACVANGSGVNVATMGGCS